MLHNGKLHEDQNMIKNNLGLESPCMENLDFGACFITFRGKQNKHTRTTFVVNVFFGTRHHLVREKGNNS